MFEPIDSVRKRPNQPRPGAQRPLRWARLYYVPFVHCPALCPFDPPPVLFSDDYDVEREETVWTFCATRCPLVEGAGRPCLERYKGRDSGGGRNGAAEVAAHEPAAASVAHSCSSANL